MLNGELIEGIQSWIRSVLFKTEEDLNDDYYVEYYNSDGILLFQGYTWNDTPVDSTLIEPGSIPRPVINASA